MKIIIGLSDTRMNNEDFAITPYLSLVWVNSKSKAFGIGVTWGYYSLFSALGINVPDGLPFFRNYARKESRTK